MQKKWCNVNFESTFIALNNVKKQRNRLKINIEPNGDFILFVNLLR